MYRSFKIRSTSDFAPQLQSKWSRVLVLLQFDKRNRKRNRSYRKPLTSNRFRRRGSLLNYRNQMEGTLIYSIFHSFTHQLLINFPIPFLILISPNSLEP